MTDTAKAPEKLLEEVMARHHYSGDALIEILHAAQQFHGYLSAPLLREVARKLRLPPSRVLGVATFYHLFRFAPPEKHTCSVCIGTACYVEGAAELVDVVKKNGWKLDGVRCSGTCGLAPLVVCDGVTLRHTTPAKLEEYLLRSAAGPV
jgi:bidirectional [NiFe] hydrogenase diaphorase subunit